MLSMREQGTISCCTWKQDGASVLALVLPPPNRLPQDHGGWNAHILLPHLHCRENPEVLLGQIAQHIYVKFLRLPGAGGGEGRGQMGGGLLPAQCSLRPAQNPLQCALDRPISLQSRARFVRGSTSNHDCAPLQLPFFSVELNTLPTTASPPGPPTAVAR